MDTNIKQILTDIVGATHIKFHEPMSQHTTFRVGGPADIFVTPGNESDLVKAINVCREVKIPYMIIGNGSNLLVGDQGIRGVVFQLYHTMAHVKFEVYDATTMLVRAGAGVSLPKLAKMIAANGLTGFEFASGIPGTFGGALAMNAGSYGGEMKQCVYQVRAMNSEGEVLVLNLDQLQMGYRTSIIQKMNYVILEASLLLEKGDQEVINQRIEDLTRQRTEKQPLEWPSAGSTFKRPVGYFAGKLIEDAGLKGYRVGGACVSEKHSGFVINDGGSSAADILQLIVDVQRIVMEKFGVMLETEVRMIGEF